jgi:predicted XRE-type DNA-binding protein
MALQTAERRSQPRVARERGEASVGIRRLLMAQLVCLIRAKGLNQVQTARWLAVDQSRISDLLNNKLRRFSTDTLLDMIARAGVSVVVSFDKIEVQVTHEVDAPSEWVPNRWVHEGS